MRGIYSQLPFCSSPTPFPSFYFFLLCDETTYLWASLHSWQSSVYFSKCLPLATCTEVMGLYTRAIYICPSLHEETHISWRTQAEPSKNLIPQDQQHPLEHWFSNRGYFVWEGTFDNIWKHFWLLWLVRGVLMASSGWRWGLMLAIPYCTGQIYLVQMLIGL